jgi:hypothetical protein
MPVKPLFTSRGLLFALLSAVLVVIAGVVSAGREGESSIVYLPAIFSLPFQPLPSPWEEVGSGSASDVGISNSPTSAVSPAAAFSADNQLYVAWVEAIGEIYLRRWNGSSWQELGGSASGGGISNTGATSDLSDVAVAPDGTPYVVWVERVDPYYEIYVRRWNGSSWEEVGPGSASGNGISNTLAASVHPTIAIGPDGIPYIAWYVLSNQNLTQSVYVRRWNGGNWEEVGPGSASGTGISNLNGAVLPTMAIAPDSTPYIAWQQLTEEGLNQIYVRRWNGSSWEEVGAVSASGGGISNGKGDSVTPSIAVAPDGTPYIAWSYGRPLITHDNDIHVRRWNGSSWEEVGSGSATGEGISWNDTVSTLPSVAVAADGTVYVVWQDWWDSATEDIDMEIYVRSWDGNSWEEVGLGSATGRGISDAPGSSAAPTIAVSPDGTPHVAWHEAGDDGNFKHIYVRRRP